MTIDSLLTEIAEGGWSLTWAFQFSPSHWRVSLMRPIDDGDELVHCADAPTLAEALEDCIAKMVEPEFVPESDASYTIDRSPPKTLLDLIGIKQEPFKRRI